jgi:hypothetical protein
MGVVAPGNGKKHPNPSHAVLLHGAHTVNTVNSTPSEKP